MERIYIVNYEYSYKGNKHSKESKIHIYDTVPTLSEMENIIKKYLKQCRNKKELSISIKDMRLKGANLNTESKNKVASIPTGVQTNPIGVSNACIRNSIYGVYGGFGSPIGGSINEIMRRRDIEYIRASLYPLIDLIRDEIIDGNLVGEEEEIWRFIKETISSIMYGFLGIDINDFISSKSINELAARINSKVSFYNTKDRKSINYVLNRYKLFIKEGTHHMSFGDLKTFLIRDIMVAYTGEKCKCINSNNDPNWIVGRCKINNFIMNIGHYVKPIKGFNGDTNIVSIIKDGKTYQIPVQIFYPLLEAIDKTGKNNK